MSANRLIQHYVDNARALPWRSRPGEPRPNPYRVWLSEVMLQQTTVAAVIPRFERFIARWPTLAALAAAPDEEILSEWAGLGYYARARNLIACAREVARRGSFPDCEDELRKLPGIGSYTAAAIAAIAFDKRAVVVDSNVARVVARLHGIAGPISSAKSRIRSLADAMTPHSGSGDFAQAMMDLGATICRSRAPLCGACPVRASCAAHSSGNPEDFPGKKRKKMRPLRTGTAWWTERQNEVWLTRRPGNGLLGGMAALPGDDWTSNGAADDVRTIARVRHVFTHFELELRIVERQEPCGEGWWHPLDELDRAGLPTLYRKAVAAVRSERRRLAA